LRRFQDLCPALHQRCKVGIAINAIEADRGDAVVGRSVENQSELSPNWRTAIRVSPKLGTTLHFDVIHSTAPNRFCTRQCTCVMVISAPFDNHI
jgi:hypothetical protein